MSNEENKRKDIWISVVIGAVVLVGVGVIIYGTLFGGERQMSPREKDCMSVPTRIEGDGEELYNKIKKGMTIEEVNSLIGFEGRIDDPLFDEKGNELSPDELDSYPYRTGFWTLNHHTEISIDFEHGKVVYTALYQDNCSKFRD